MLFEKLQGLEHLLPPVPLGAFNGLVHGSLHVMGERMLVAVSMR